MSKIYERRYITFEIEVKRLLRGAFEAGNKAMPLDGGDPSDYGHLDDEDMAFILREAASEMMKDPTEYLYRCSPLPRKKKAA